MKITTAGELTIDSVQFTALFPIKADDFVTKTFTDKDSGKTETKVAPDGSNRVQYRTALKALRIDENGNPFAEEREVTLAILEPIDILPGVMYGLSGVTQIVHYQNDAKRQCVSIVAERVKPVNEMPRVKVADILGYINRPIKPQG